jgi:hypothetical protein
MPVHMTQLLVTAQHSICTVQDLDTAVVMFSPDVLRHLVASLLMEKPGFNPRIVHVGFLTDRVAGSPWKFWFFLANCHPINAPYTSVILACKTGPSEATFPRDTVSPHSCN